MSEGTLFKHRSVINALPHLIAVAAEASASPGAPAVILGELCRVVQADRAQLRVFADRSEAERTITVLGPDQTSANNPSEAMISLPLRRETRELGTLSLYRAETFSEAELTVVTAAINLLLIEIGRDSRVVVLETELSARVMEVAHQRAFIERVVDSLPFGLYVVDREYRIHAWNHKRETGLQGVSRTEAIGRTIFDVLNRQPAALLKTEFDDVFATGQLQQFQMESDAFGDTRTFRISKIPMCLEDGSVSHVITVGEDITDWRAAIERTAQSEKLAALGQLAAGVMHEINNPLATIAACGESLSLHQELQAARPGGQSGSGVDPAEMLRIIDLEVHRCKKIINGLLDFARTKPAAHETFDLHVVVQHGLFLLKHHPRFKRVVVVQDFDITTPLLVTGDSDQLVQVMIALALNAIDASPDQGRITIACRAMENALGEDIAVLEVADEGPGVPKAMHAKVFEPFFTTKPTGQGTGLGLAICYGIVKDHNGQLELVHGDGPGACFRVSLPLVSTSTEQVT